MSRKKAPVIHAAEILRIRKVVNGALEVGERLRECAENSGSEEASELVDQIIEEIKLRVTKVSGDILESKMSVTPKTRKRTK